MDDTIELTNEVPQHTKNPWPNLIMKLASAGLLVYGYTLANNIATTKWRDFKAGIVKEELSNIGNAELTFDKAGKKIRLKDADYKQAQAMMLMLMNERDVCLNRVAGIKSAIEYGY